MIERFLAWLAAHQRRQHGMDEQSERTRAVLMRTERLIDEQAEYTRRAQQDNPITGRLRATPHTHGGCYVPEK